jgi:L-iditol 2-dehydrogenase
MSPAAVDSQSLPETSSINGKAHISVHELDLESQKQSKRNGAGLLHYPKDLANAINPSLQVTASHKLKLVPAPVREPAHGEVLIHVKATGICGSDIHFWKSGRIGSLEVDQDCILGHEAAGVVLRVGEGVTNVKQGDRIAIEPGVPCGNCFLCIEGRYNLCEDVHFAGVCPHDGSVQRYKCHPANWVHKMPDNLSFRQGALLEPLSVVMHGISMGKLGLGRGCAVHGAGPIGLILFASPSYIKGVPK